MFCPRCGRPVNAEANFCGGCGLSKVEIEKYLSRTAPQQEPAPQPEMPKAEPVFTQPAAPKAEEAPAAEIPQCEMPKAEPVFTEPEAVKAEETTFEPVKETQQPSYADNNCTYAYSYKKDADAKPENQHSYTSTTANNSYTSGAAYTASYQPEVKKEVPLTTVDFIWMLVLSSLPVIGLIYIIYLAVQDNNINKRSYARAMLIVSLFSIIIAAVFAVGVVAAGLM